MKAVLEALLSVSECDYVFTHPGDPSQPLGAWVLETQMGALRTRIRTHPDAGLHGLRHTFLTEAGEHTDPFTLQYTAGHDNIKTTMRYVHPQANAVHTLFARLTAQRSGKLLSNGTMQKVVTKTDTPHRSAGRGTKQVVEIKRF
jgi:integrase